MIAQLETAPIATKDYYEILQVDPDADIFAIDDAYWRLARLHNAALATDLSAKERMDDLNDAYRVLRSPALRRQFDQEWEAAQTDGESASSGSQSRRARHLGWPAAWRLRLPRLNFGWVVLPGWQASLSIAVVLALATGVFVFGVQPLLVVALVTIGLAVAAFRFVRRPPRLPELPNFTVPAVRLPHLPERLPGRGADTETDVDADALRQSTKAVVDRWRQAAQGAPTSDLAELAEPGKTLLAGSEDLS